jgi:predicted Rossmann fold nucleotide-binding protein DprA/Smf involved in DNA uptake
MLLPRLVVVAGLAPGIDTRTHRAALECGVLTVAVVGSGLDRVGNGLADAVLDRGGAIVSELRNGTLGNEEWRLARDRIQSGLFQWKHGDGLHMSLARTLTVCDNAAFGGRSGLGR